MILATIFTFTVERSWKNMYFHPAENTCSFVWALTYQSNLRRINYTSKTGCKNNLEKCFWYVAVFETILPLPQVESLWSSLQGEVYFRGGGVARGLWRHQQWPPFWPPPWILPRIRNEVKSARNGIFLCFTWKITHK